MVWVTGGCEGRKEMALSGGIYDDTFLIPSPPESPVPIGTRKPWGPGQLAEVTGGRTSIISS